MSEPRFRVGEAVQYQGDSTRLNGRIGIIKRVRRDELNPDQFNYSVKFSGSAWKVHERNLSLVEAVMDKTPVFRSQYGEPDRANHAQLSREDIERLHHNMTKPPLVLNKVETGRVSGGAVPLDPSARPEPMPITRGGRVEITKGIAKGLTGVVLRVYSDTLGRMGFDVRLDNPPRDWALAVASFPASCLAPLVEKTPEKRGLWKDGKKVHVLDFNKILRPKGTMHGPVDGMIMANALTKQPL